MAATGKYSRPLDGIFEDIARAIEKVEHNPEVLDEIRESVVEHPPPKQEV